MSALAAPEAVLDVYCRISVDYDGTTRSVESQEEDALDVIADTPGWQVGTVHKDHAKSAWNPRITRPEWDALMARLEAGQTDGVLVYDLSRFTRKPSEGERLLALAEQGIAVASLTTTYNLRTADGRKQFRDAMNAAAYESDKISERSSRGKRKKARKGRSNASWRGFARPGYLLNPEGWQPGDPRTPVPAAQLEREVAAVRAAAAHLLDGGTLASVVRQWNDAGLTTVKGNRWDGTRVRDLLTAPSLAGLASYRGEVVGTLEGEPVLDRDTWDRLGLYFASRTRGRPTSEAYLLSGFMVCGRCGATMLGRPLVAKPPYSDGQVQRSYWCAYRPATGLGCGRVAMDQRAADRAVEAMVVARLNDPRHADRVNRTRARMTEARRAVVQELAALNEEADQVASKTGTPGWSPARVDAALANYAPRIADAEARLAAMGMPDADEAYTTTEDAQVDWTAATPEQRRALVRRTFPEGLVCHPAKSRGTATRKEVRIHPGQ